MTTIGMIGLGQMGAGVAERLLDDGHDLVVWNRSPAPVGRLAAKGAQPAASPAAAFDADVVFSMLSEDSVIEEVLLDSGALAHARRGAVHVNLSTISVGLARRLEALHREQGLFYVASPVLGRPDVAAAGQLVAIVAGDPAGVTLARPLIERFTRKVWPMGDEAARANVVKLACNFALASMIETLGEAGALVAAHDVAPAELFEVMTEGLFAAPAYKIYAPLIAERRFSPPGFGLKLGLKDVRLALQAGEEGHAPLPIASVLRDQFIAAIAAGDADLDWAALSRSAFRAAGLSGQS